MDQEIYPYKYHAFGLNVASRFVITAFKEAVFEIADVFIYEANVPEDLEIIINKSPIFQSNDHEFLIKINSVGSFLIRDGREIIIKQFNDDVTTFIIGACFGALLHQRGLLPLHASSVVFNDKGILIAGISGAGKSTLATAFIRKGGNLIADDISCIYENEKQLVILPSFPTIKIWQDSLIHFNLFNPDLQKVRDSLLKYYYPIEAFHDHPSRIHFIIVLSSTNSPNIEIKEIQGIEKFSILKKNTYFFRGIEGTQMVQQHFYLMMNLASTIPVYLLKRPLAGFESEKIIKAISDKLDIA